ncbi:FUN34 transmembrane protein [Mycena rosella]|uniref:FUN34 transmembrane protein n=1 Tax=Mycena rosella TaxID=1033263 RepID=A0AAD7MAL3_MYCRO|nr:FUN34 transmembrane protein [Mycena rosella]
MADIEKGEHGGAGSALTRASHPTGVANPAALGLFSFASTTFILSFYNVSVRGIHHPNAVVGMALFTGGLAQLLAGMWEFPRGNTFGATAFSSYGAFWLSYATILLPGSGILAAYKTEAEANSAIGIFLMSWFIVTFFFLIASLRKSIAFVALFGFLSVTFLLLGAGAFTGKQSVTTAGGALGIVTAFIAYYIGLSDLLAAERAAVVGLPTGGFKHD